jgi:2-polyprenyl-3-methyl-5-hydroxy-6-metoxy-1,4-benzoquinol methylase
VPVTDPEGHELEALRRAGVDFTGRRVLDVGCGDGRLVWPTAEPARSVLGIDTDEEAIATAIAETPASLERKVQFRVASVVDLDEPESQFDLVFFTWSL